MDLSSWVIGGVGTAPVWGTLLWCLWQLSIRPRLIPAGEIRVLADEMVASYGPRAEEIALIEEDSAWRSSEAFEQGKWHRVRRELWRRHAAGAWDGPGE